MAAIARLVAARLAGLPVSLLLVACLRPGFALALFLRAPSAFVGRLVLASASLAGGVGLLTAPFLAAA